MENEMFKRVGQYQYSSEAYIYKGKLESEGIEVFIRDHHTVNTDPLVSNAIGGVKLFVRTEDHDKALRIMEEISKYSVDDSGKLIMCPKCNATNIQLLTTVRDRKGLLAFIFSTLISASLPIYTKYIYKCNNCNFEFEQK